MDLAGKPDSRERPVLVLDVLQRRKVGAVV
jgi:hypothetical protein